MLPYMAYMDPMGNLDLLIRGHPKKKKHYRFMVDFHGFSIGKITNYLKPRISVPVCSVDAREESNIINIGTND